MALTHPVKLVLKSTTTQTLSDRFTEMMRNKSPGTTRQRERAREENIAQSRASAKNRRLAEQMSNRRDAVMDQFENANGANGGGEVNVKSRLDQSRINARGNVRERLGRTNNTNGSVQTRLGTTRGAGASANGGGGGGGRLRGRSLSRGRLDNVRGSTRSFNTRGARISPRRGGGGGGGGAGFNRGSSQQRVGRFQGGRTRGRGGGDNRGGGRGFTRGRSRSRGRGGRGGRGSSGGGNTNRFVDRGDLDSELDTYMSKNNGM